MTVGIRYVDGPRLARSLFAAAAGREEINRITVFPVPDGDTETNFSLTLRAVADALRALGDASLSGTARTAARGNSGMMLAHFLLGFADAIDGRDQITAQEVALAIHQGAERLSTSLDDPREGTILTVAREAPIAAERAANDSPDISVFMARLLAEGELSLARTPELMAVLKEAGVFDAGGVGFVRMIEGVVRLIDGDPILPAAPFAEAAEAMMPAALAGGAAGRDFQFCTEVRVRSSQLPAANEVRTQLRNFGGSVQVVVAGDILKVHVHTNTPEAVFTYAGRWGTIDATKAEDMRAQHRRLAHDERRPVAVVAARSCDLPDVVLDRHHIALVPLQVMFGDETIRDRVELKLRSGRVTRGKAWLAGLLNVKPILGLDGDGAVVPLNRVRGGANVVPRVLSLLEKQLSPKPAAVRFGIAHAEAPEAAERVRAALMAAYRPKDCFVSLATAVPGTHVGVGAWALFWQVEDGTPTHPAGTA